ncbi:MAG: CorA family divalent cation transporter [Pseudomonadota bacterium]
MASDGDGAPAAHAFLIEDATATPLDWAAAQARVAAPPASGYLWLQHNRADARAAALQEDLDHGGEVRAALVEPVTEPRAALLAAGALVILRGCDQDAGDALHRLVSLRLFVARRVVISARMRRHAATHALAAEIAGGRAPATPAAFVERLAALTIDQLEHAVRELDQRVDRLETLALAEPTGALRARRLELNALRRFAVLYRRHMRPQADALAALAAAPLPGADEATRAGLSETADQARRMAADVEELYDRAALVGGEIHMRVADRTNRTILTLTVVSTVFMPLSFVAGLLGVNLAGIPFANEPWAFGALAGGLAALSLAMGATVWMINRR